MKIAALFSPWLLEHRKNNNPPGLDFSNLYIDGKGLTGSEYGVSRICEELVKLGHSVDLFTVTSDTEWRGVKLHKFDDPKKGERYDAAASWLIPDELRGIDATFKTTIYWNNNYTFCKVGFEEHCDLFISPSEPHRQMALHTWRDVQDTPQGPLGRYVADPEKWIWIPLGVDPQQYGHEQKIPGRVIYCSSPDRGLHHLLAEWPNIKAAVPHATLHVFYRLQPWVDQILAVPETFEPMRTIRERCVTIAKILPHAAELGITIRDAVSRQQIEIEQSRAEVLAYPCDTTQWSEGWSCSTHEGCIAKACPVITDCDAFGEVYGGVLPMVHLDRSSLAWRAKWRDLVIRALMDPDFRDEVNTRAYAWAVGKTWGNTARLVADAIESRMSARAA